MLLINDQLNLVNFFISYLLNVVGKGFTIISFYKNLEEIHKLEIEIAERNKNISYSIGRSTEHFTNLEHNTQSKDIGLTIRN